MTSQPIQKKPGDPDRCLLESCLTCEHFELCHSVIAPNEVDLKKIGTEIAEREHNLHNASRDNHG